MRSSWSKFAPHNFIATEYQRFSDIGITHIVDLRKEEEVDSELVRLEQLNIARLQASVPNHGALKLEQLTEIADRIEAMSSDSVVYVHCGGGFGRATTKAVGLLLAAARRTRPEFRINADQLAWQQTVEEHLRDKQTK